MGQGCFNSIHYRNGVGISSLLQNRQIDRTLPVHSDNVVLELLGILSCLFYKYDDVYILV